MKTWQHDTDAPLSDDELGAFADGQLPQRRAARVAVQIRRHPEHADRIYHYWRSEAALYQAFRPVLETPLTGWTPSAPKRSFYQRPVTLAAAASVLVLLVLAGYRGSQPEPVAPLNMVDLALNAYLNAPYNGEALGGAAPVFADLGLQPQGGRVLQLGGRQIAEFRYRDGEQRPLALYRTDNQSHYRDGWLHILPQGQVPLVEWSVDGQRYLLVGGASSMELARLAVDMKAQLPQSGLSVESAPPTVPGSDLQEAYPAPDNGAARDVLHRDAYGDGEQLVTDL